MTRLLLAACVLLVLAAPARADVRVTLAPETTPAQVRQADAYVVHVEADEPVSLADLLVLLPGHGQPCGQPDEYGYPYGGDPSTNFSVPPQPGVSVSGRWVTIAGPFLVDPTSPLDYRLAVTLPDIAACFYAGSTADLDPSSPQVPVLGIAQGGELDVVQHVEFSTGGVLDAQRYPRITAYWWAYNGSDQPVTVVRWRFGLPAGFTFLSSDLGAPKVRNVTSLSLQWEASTVVAPHDYAYAQVAVHAPCGIGTVHARLRVWRSDGLVAGTGDGPPLDLEACP